MNNNILFVLLCLCLLVLVSFYHVTWNGIWQNCSDIQKFLTYVSFDIVHLHCTQLHTGHMLLHIFILSNSKHFAVPANILSSYSKENNIRTKSNAFNTELPLPQYENIAYVTTCIPKYSYEGNINIPFTILILDKTRFSTSIEVVIFLSCYVWRQQCFHPRVHFHHLYIIIFVYYYNTSSYTAEGMSVSRRQTECSYI